MRLQKGGKPFEVEQMMHWEKILLLPLRESTLNLALSRTGRNLRSLVRGASDISGWLWKSRLKYLQPTGFEDSVDARIRGLQQCEVVECMCKNMVQFNALWWQQMITARLLSWPYWLGNQTIPRCLAVPPRALR